MSNVQKKSADPINLFLVEQNDNFDTASSSFLISSVNKKIHIAYIYIFDYFTIIPRVASTYNKYIKQSVSVFSRK